LTHHIRRQHKDYSSKKYYDEFLGKQKEAQFISLERGYASLPTKSKFTTCKICDTETNSIGMHLTLKHKEEKYCSCCKEEKTFDNINKGYRKNCKTERTKTTNKEKYGGEIMFATNHFKETSKQSKRKMCRVL